MKYRNHPRTTVRRVCMEVTRLKIVGDHQHGCSVVTQHWRIHIWIIVIICRSLSLHYHVRFDFFLSFLPTPNIHPHRCIYDIDLYYQIQSQQFHYANIVPILACLDPEHAPYLIYKDNYCRLNMIGRERETGCDSQ